MVLVSAMHITAGVYVNDWETAHPRFPGWLEKLAPAGSTTASSDGEDNADAHLKRTIMGHQVMLPITKARSISARGSRSSTPSSTDSAQARRRESDGRLTRAMIDPWISCGCFTVPSTRVMWRP
jgi:hypothetical protein